MAAPPIDQPTHQRWSLASLGEDVDDPDDSAAQGVRARAPQGSGRLGELAGWLAGVRSPSAPGLGRIRLVAVLSGNDATVSKTIATVAEASQVSVRPLAVPSGGEFAGTSAAAAFGAGVRVADDEIDSGADLLGVADADRSAAAGVLVGSITGAEPVALLPRGADAIDSAAWIERAAYLRDTGRRVAELRGQHDRLLAAIGSATLAASAGLIMRASPRRTPVVLDGTSALAAALLCCVVNSATAQWWQVADTSPDPVHSRAVDHLELPPVLAYGTSRGDGLAGLLAVATLISAAVVAAEGTPR